MPEYTEAKNQGTTYTEGFNEAFKSAIAYAVTDLGYTRKVPNLAKSVKFGALDFVYSEFIESSDSFPKFKLEASTAGVEVADFSDVVMKYLYVVVMGLVIGFVPNVDKMNKNEAMKYAVAYVLRHLYGKVYESTK